MTVPFFPLERGGQCPLPGRQAWTEEGTHEERPDEREREFVPPASLSEAGDKKVAGPNRRQESRR